MGDACKKASTIDYLESAESGAIVAFKAEIKGIMRTISGKLIEKIVDNTSSGPITSYLIETKNGSMFEIGSSDIIWVKTGERWPRWVFEELKKK